MFPLQRPVAQTMRSPPQTPPQTSLQPATKTAVKMMLPSDILATSIRPAVEGQGIKLIGIGTNCLLGLDAQGKLVPIQLKENEILVGKDEHELPGTEHLQDILDLLLSKIQEHKEPESPIIAAPTVHQSLPSPPVPSLSIPKDPVVLPPKESKESKRQSVILQQTASESLSVSSKNKYRIPRILHIYPHPSAPRLMTIGIASVPKEYGALVNTGDDALSEHSFLSMRPIRHRFGTITANPDVAGISSMAGTFVTRFGWQPEFECTFRAGARLKKSTTNRSPLKSKPTVTKFQKPSASSTEVKTASFQPRDSFRIWVGLGDQEQIFLVDQLSSHRFIGFRYSSALDSVTGTWKCITSDGSHQSSKDNQGLTITDSKIKFEEQTPLTVASRVSESGANVEFYINTQLVATHITSLPDKSTPLGISCVLLNTGNDGVSELGLSKFSVMY